MRIRLSWLCLDRIRYSYRPLIGHASSTLCRVGHFYVYSYTSGQYKSSQKCSNRDGCLEKKILKRLYLDSQHCNLIEAFLVLLLEQIKSQCPSYVVSIITSDSFFWNIIPCKSFSRMNWIHAQCNFRELFCVPLLLHSFKMEQLIEQHIPV